MDASVWSLAVEGAIMWKPLQSQQLYKFVTPRDAARFVAPRHSLAVRKSTIGV